MPRRIRSHVLASAAALTVASATIIGLYLPSYEVTAPSEARERATAAAATEHGPSPDCSKAKCVALTFDAGPGPYTAELLDILKRENVHATFFLLGEKHITKHPNLVRRIADEGHELGNHTWTHPILTDVGTDRVRRELTRTQQAITKLTGRTPTLMRPPQGRTDEDVSEVSRQLGLAQVLWSVTAKDYKTNNSALITKRVLEQTERDGVILLHDIYKGTVPAVPGIIDKLKKRGYTIVTVSQLMAPAEPEPGMVYRP